MIWMATTSPLSVRRQRRQTHAFSSAIYKAAASLSCNCERSTEY